MSHTPDNPNARVFFALWPNATERKHLAAWQASLKRLCGGRAMRGETLHNTLVFIGNVELYGLEVLQLAAQEISGEGFELCFDEARYWGHNHIVYAAPRRVPQQLAQLVDALEQRLIAHHFKFDSPHPNLPPEGEGTIAAPHSELIRGLGKCQAMRGDMHLSRDYQPHVTLLRNAHWTDAPLPEMQPVRWEIRDFALVQSVHRDGLASYRVLARFPLSPCGG